MGWTSGFPEITETGCADAFEMTFRSATRHLNLEARIGHQTSQLCTRHKSCLQDIFSIYMNYIWGSIKKGKFSQ